MKLDVMVLGKFQLESAKKRNKSFYGLVKFAEIIREQLEIYFHLVFGGSFKTFR